MPMSTKEARGFDHFNNEEVNDSHININENLHHAVSTGEDDAAVEQKMIIRSDMMTTTK